MLKTGEQEINNKQRLFLNGVFFAFVALLLISRIILFFHLNLQHIDSDQPVMWMGAKDFSKGFFHEPRYYGQNYNTMMEGLLAAPLLWLNVPVYYAVPVATHVLFLFPFLFPAFYLFKRQKKIQAIAVLGLVMCMTAGYDISNSISRGFVTGLFFTSFFIISLEHPQKLSWLLFNSLMAAFGYFVNPNSVLVSCPLLFYLFLHNYKNKSYYLVNVLVLLAAVGFHFLFNGFYTSHPDYVVLGLHLKFSFESFLDNISHLDERFRHLSFFMEGVCWPLLAGMIILLTALLKENKKAAFSLILFIALLLFCFSLTKTLEGSSWPFYSFNRMYLGIIPLMCLYFSFLKLRSKFIIGVFVFVPFAFSVYKSSTLKQSIDFYCQPGQVRRLQIFKLKPALEAIGFYKEVCEKNKINHLLISTNFWFHSYLNYGGPALYDDFPSCQETDTDRRYWVREKNSNHVFKAFILLSATNGFEKRVFGNPDFTLAKLDDYGMYLVTENKLNTSRFIDLVKAVEFER